jgi:hypothetical protein
VTVLLPSLSTLCSISPGRDKNSNVLAADWARNAGQKIVIIISYFLLSQHHNENLARFNC